LDKYYYDLSLNDEELNFLEEKIQNYIERPSLNALHDRNIAVAAAILLQVQRVRYTKAKLV